MAGDLWNIIDGEPWLDNPAVYMFGNPKRRKRGKKMAVRRRRRRTGRKAAAPRRRRRTVRANPPRRRRRVARRVGLRNSPRRRRRVARRRYRRNPISLAGFNMKDLLMGGGAVIVAPMLEKQILPLLPASMAGTPTGRWAVKIGAALGTFYLAKYTMGRRAAEVASIALGSALIADAVSEFAPSLTSGLTAYTPVGMRAYTRGGLRGNGMGLVMPGQMARGGMRGLGPGQARLGPLASSGVFAPPF